MDGTVLKLLSLEVRSNARCIESFMVFGCTRRRVDPILLLIVPVARVYHQRVFDEL